MHQSHGELTEKKTAVEHEYRGASRLRRYEFTKKQEDKLKATGKTQAEIDELLKKVGFVKLTDTEIDEMFESLKIHEPDKWTDAKIAETKSL